MNDKEKDTFIKNPFDAPRSKYRAFYKSLKATNDKNEARFLRDLRNKIKEKG